MVIARLLMVITEGRLKPGDVFQRFLASSFIAPFVFDDSDVGFGGGLALTDTDFRATLERSAPFRVDVGFSNEGAEVTAAFGLGFWRVSAVSHAPRAALLQTRAGSRYPRIMRRMVRTFSVLAAVLAVGSLAGARSLATFGMCLAREGTIFYGASWCPQCRAQREILGGASRYVRYVECSVDGGRDTTEKCRDADITKYPTWVFPDGSRQTGRLSIETLAARSGCALDDGEDED